MSDKVIGVVGYKIGDGGFGVGAWYLDFISKFGKPRIIMPWEKEGMPIDALLLPGGLDISPDTYGQVPGYVATNVDVYKQHFYEKVLPLYMEKVPIIGICLGFQMINTLFGGTLVQDLPLHPTSSKRWEAAHGIRYTENAPENFFELYQKKAKKRDEILVNSHHHQGVTNQTLGEGLVPLAYSTAVEDGIDSIVEAFKHRDLPIVGFQWHPEEWRDNFSRHMINEVLSVMDIGRGRERVALNFQ